MGQVQATRQSKPRKSQTTFSQHQLIHLETCYRLVNFLTTPAHSLRDMLLVSLGAMVRTGHHLYYDYP